MSELILWTDDGDGPLLGRAGTLAHPLFAITGRPRQWVLLESWLPPWSASRAPVATSDDVGPEALKARAEELLREFTSSVGAVFPGTDSEVYMAGAAAERERVTELATEHRAVYQDENGDTQDFADLIGDDR